MNGKFARMKKLAVIAAIMAAMAFGLVACGKPSDEQKQGTDEPQTQGLETSPTTDEDQNEGQGLDQEQPDQQATDGDEDSQPVGDGQSSDDDQVNVEGQPDEGDQDASTASQSAMEEQTDGTDQPADTRQAAAEDQDASTAGQSNAEKQTNNTDQPSGDEEASTSRPLTEEEKASGEYEELIPGVWVKKTDVEEEQPSSDDEQPSVNGLSTPEEFMAAGYVEIKPGLWAPRESAIELGYITEDDTAEGTDAGAEAVPPATNDTPSGTEPAGGNDAGTVVAEQESQVPYVDGHPDWDSQEFHDALQELVDMINASGGNAGMDIEPGGIDPNAPNITLR